MLKSIIKPLVTAIALVAASSAAMAGGGGSAPAPLVTCTFSADSGNQTCVVPIDTSVYPVTLVSTAVVPSSLLPGVSVISENCAQAVANSQPTCNVTLQVNTTGMVPGTYGAGLAGFYSVEFEQEIVYESTTNYFYFHASLVITEATGGGDTKGSTTYKIVVPR